MECGQSSYHRFVLLVLFMVAASFALHSGLLVERRAILARQEDAATGAGVADEYAQDTGSVRVVALAREKRDEIGGAAPHVREARRSAATSAATSGEQLRATSRPTRTDSGGSELEIDTPHQRYGWRHEVVAFSPFVLEDASNETRVGAGEPLQIVASSGIESVVVEGRVGRAERDVQLRRITRSSQAASSEPEVLANSELGRRYSFRNALSHRELRARAASVATAARDPSVKLVPSSPGEYRRPYGSCRASAVRLRGVARAFLRTHPLAARVFDNSTGFPDVRWDSAIEHERCQAVIVRILFVFSVVMDELGLGGQWFLTHGSLLGAVRHGGIIPWDVDVDVAISRRAYNRLERTWHQFLPRDMFHQTYYADGEFRLQVGSKNSGFYEQTRIVDRYGTYTGYKFPYKGRLPRYYHVGPMLDLIPIYTNKATGRRMLLNTPTNATLLYPTKLMCFDGVLLPVPNKYEVVLDLIYGKGEWRSFPPEKMMHYNYFQASRCRASTPAHVGKWALDVERDLEKLAQWRNAVASLGNNSALESPSSSSSSAAVAITTTAATTQAELERRLGATNDIWSRNDPVTCHYQRKKAKLACFRNPSFVSHRRSGSLPVGTRNQSANLKEEDIKDERGTEEVDQEEERGRVGVGSDLPRDDEAHTAAAAPMRVEDAASDE